MLVATPVQIFRHRHCHRPVLVHHGRSVESARSKSPDWTSSKPVDLLVVVEHLVMSVLACPEAAGKGEGVESTAAASGGCSGGWPSMSMVSASVM